MNSQYISLRKMTTVDGSVIIIFSVDTDSALGRCLSANLPVNNEASILESGIKIKPQRR
jgi:hypothetical protein